MNVEYTNTKRKLEPKDLQYTQLLTVTNEWVKFIEMYKNWQLKLSNGRLKEHEH